MTHSMPLKLHVEIASCLYETTQNFVGGLQWALLNYPLKIASLEDNYICLAQALDKLTPAADISL